MKNNLKNYTVVLKAILAQVFLAVAINITHAQINGSDPSLVTWLQASAINTNIDLMYQGVTNWPDSSSYGSIIRYAPAPLLAADPNNITNETPQYAMVTNNGDVFPAVQFRQSQGVETAVTNAQGQIISRDDRMWETNISGAPLDATDPTLIPASSNITFILVYEDTLPSTTLGPTQEIFDKRGPHECPFEFAAAATSASFVQVFYTDADTPNFVESTNSFQNEVEWRICEYAVTTNTVTFRQYSSLTGTWTTETYATKRDPIEVGDPCCFSMSTLSSQYLSYRFSGYIAEAALWNRSLSSDELAGIENSLLGEYFLQPGPPTFTQEPFSQTVGLSGSVTFTCIADGTPPFTYQWLTNDVPIAGANSPSYTVTNASYADAANYSVIISNSISFAQSTNAVLMVIAETNRPTILSALVNYVNDTLVTVTYSEPVSAVTAINASNYSINNSVTVSSVAAVTNAANQISSVVLTTSGVTTPPSVLTVNGVQDIFGNTIATNSQATIPVPGALVGTPPSTNMLLWLAADDTADIYDTNGYTITQGGYIGEWDDQSPEDYYFFESDGYAQMGQIATANAIHPAVNFNGLASLKCVDSTPFIDMTNFTIYVVADCDNTKGPMFWCGAWSGWGFGVASSPLGMPELSCAYQNSVSGDIDSRSAIMGYYVPTLIEASSEDYGSESLYFDGALVDTVSTNAGLIHEPGLVTMTLGALSGGTDGMIGDIEEMLIYTNSSPAQDAAVNSYLISKYFTPSATVPALASATLGATNTSVTVIFSEAVSMSTATNASNYSINNGVTVSAVTWINSTTVSLTTSPIYGGAYTLTASGVTDWAGNGGPSSQVAIGGIPAPLITITSQGSSVSITWTALPPYKLQSASGINGPWSDVGGATSPYMVEASQASQFYRLSQ